MKFKSSFLYLAIIACLFLAVPCVQSGVVTVFGSYSTLVAPTNAYSGIIQSNINLQLQTGTFTTTYSNLLQTNDLVGFVQFSLDGTNYVTATNLYYPSVTNAVAGDTINPFYVSMPVYIRMGASVTNGHNVFLGAQYTHN